MRHFSNAPHSGHSALLRKCVRITTKPHFCEVRAYFDSGLGATLTRVWTGSVRSRLPGGGADFKRASLCQRGRIKELESYTKTSKPNRSPTSCPFPYVHGFEPSLYNARFPAAGD